MNITAAAIKYNRVTYLMLAVVLLLGVVRFTALPRNSMPPFTIRVASVVTSFPGAGPERVESLITQRIEEVAQEISEVDFISSESRTGVSIVQINLKENVPAAKLQPIWDRLRRKIDAIQGEFPEGIHGPEVKDDDVGAVYGIQIGLASDGFEYAEVKKYADDLRQELIKLSDAAKVEIGGVIEERIFAEFDNAKLSSLGLSSSQLRSTISAANIIAIASRIVSGRRVIATSIISKVKVVLRALNVARAASVSAAAARSIITPEIISRPCSVRNSNSTSGAARSVPP